MPNIAAANRVHLFNVLYPLQGSGDYTNTMPWAIPLPTRFAVGGKQPRESASRGWRNSAEPAAAVADRPNGGQGGARTQSVGLAPLNAAQVQTVLDQLLPFEVRHGQKFNVNRLWGDGEDAGTGSPYDNNVVDDIPKSMPRRCGTTRRSPIRPPAIRRQRPTTPTTTFCILPLPPRPASTIRGSRGLRPQSLLLDAAVGRSRIASPLFLGQSEQFSRTVLGDGPDAP